MQWFNIISIGLGAVVLAIVAKGYANSLRLELREETVVIPELPPAFHGFRLLFLTDLHFARTASIPRLLTLVEAVQPELICLGGDYTQGTRTLPLVTEFLSALASYGSAVGIYGNTDYRHDLTNKARKQWAEIIPFLANNAMAIEREGQSLWVAGVNDPHLGLDNLARALQTVPPDVPVILLAHSPEIINRQLDPRIRLILCGHTHGGQLCLPGGKALHSNTTLPARFASGRHQLKHAVLYVSRGVGSTRVPLRLNCLPEATLFTLTRDGEGR